MKRERRIYSLFDLGGALGTVAAVTVAALAVAVVVSRAPIRGHSERRAPSPASGDDRGGGERGTFTAPAVRAEEVHAALSLGPAPAMPPPPPAAPMDPDDPPPPDDPADFDPPGAASVAPVGRGEAPPPSPSLVEDDARRARRH